MVRLHVSKHSSAVHKSSLSLARQRLVSAMQSLGFGRIEQLHVVDGDPVLTPPPRFFRRWKSGGENQVRPEFDVNDFVLKQEVVDFLHELDKFGSGVIPLIEIWQGVPRLADFEESNPM
ncbi:MAG: hypothetical protein IT442_17190 [Phycisphaeraceae bacterium]|nr:hypothetical protein [Phycisphaeraceae bacterium]